MPTGAVWLMVSALAVVALRQNQLLVVGANVVLALVLGYCLQGLAVLKFVLKHRGVRTAVIWVLFLFVGFFALPILVVVSGGIGLADVWLDLRRRVQVGPEGQEA